jgi:hypothetical protein
MEAGGNGHPHWGSIKPYGHPSYPSTEGQRTGCWLFRKTWELLAKILSYSPTVKREIAPGNSLGFQARIEDLHLKCGILGDDSKNTTSGCNCPSAQDLNLEQT